MQMIQHWPRWTLSSRLWLCGLLAAGMMLALVWAVQPSPPVGHTDNVPALRWISGLLVAPLLESMLLVWWADRCARKGIHADRLLGMAFVAAAPLAALHLLNNWQNVFVVLPVFVAQAVVYLELRRRGHARATALPPVVLMHAMHNALALLGVEALELWLG